MSSGRSAVPEPGRTRPVSAAQVRAYAAKAQEFAEAAASDLEACRNIAATSLAIHAGINSADAVCGARLGKRAAGEDHDQVLALLRHAGPDGAEIERDLRRLLPLKTSCSTGSPACCRIRRRDSGVGRAVLGRQTPEDPLEGGPGTRRAHPLGWALTWCFVGGGGRI